MIKMMLLIAAFSAASYSANAFEPSAYLCHPESSVGYRYDETDKKWYATTFLTSEKYILRALDLEGRDKKIESMVKSDHWKPTWGFFIYKNLPTEQSSGSSVEAFCKKETNIFDKNSLTCERNMIAVSFNENNSRFIAHYYGNYLSSPPVGQESDTPFLMIGDCEPYTDTE